jgi:hypothetical protein
MGGVKVWAHGEEVRPVRRVGMLRAEAQVDIAGGLDELKGHLLARREQLRRLDRKMRADVFEARARVAQPRAARRSRIELDGTTAGARAEGGREARDLNAAVGEGLDAGVRAVACEVVHDLVHVLGALHLVVGGEGLGGPVVRARLDVHVLPEV